MSDDSHRPQDPAPRDRQPEEFTARETRPGRPGWHVLAVLLAGLLLVLLVWIPLERWGASKAPQTPPAHETLPKSGNQTPPAGTAPAQ